MFLLLFIILIIYLVCTADKRKERRLKQAGKEGEKKVADTIEEISNEGSRLINNLILYDKKGKTFQIDHLFINTNGIWIIETKNWSGTIYGDEEDKYWTQQKKYSSESRYNPIKQNYGHYYKIKPLLKGNARIHCLVVFIDADISNIQSEHICSLIDLPNFLLRETGDILTDIEIEKYYQIIRSLQEECNISIEEHERIIEDNKKKIAKKLCPNCSGKLVKRNGANGAFYGCTNFPHCKFTINDIDKCA